MVKSPLPLSSAKKKVTKWVVGIERTFSLKFFNEATIDNNEELAGIKKKTCVSWSHMILREKSVKLTLIVNFDLHCRGLFGHKRRRHRLKDKFTIQEFKNIVLNTRSKH